MIRFLKGVAAAAIVTATFSAPVKSMPVEVPQDIVFVFDTSGSLSQSGFDTVIDFMSDIVNTYASDPLHPTRFGAVRFATGTEVVYNLTDDQTPSAIVAALQNVNYDGGQTHTRDALNDALTLFDTQSDGNHPKTLLLITDGAPFPTQSQEVCHNGSMKQNLDNADVQVNVVGVGANYVSSPISCLVDDTNSQIILITDFAGDSVDFHRDILKTQRRCRPPACF